MILYFLMLPGWNEWKTDVEKLNILYKGFDYFTFVLISCYKRIFVLMGFFQWHVIKFSYKLLEKKWI